MIVQKSVQNWRFAARCAGGSLFAPDAAIFRDTQSARQRISTPSDPATPKPSPSPSSSPGPSPEPSPSPNPSTGHHGAGNSTGRAPLNRLRNPLRADAIAATLSTRIALNNSSYVSIFSVENVSFT